MSDDWSCPCGVRVRKIDDKFVFEPCSLDCELYRYVLEEAAAPGQGDDGHRSSMSRSPAAGRLRAAITEADR